MRSSRRPEPLIVDDPARTARLGLAMLAGFAVLAVAGGWPRPDAWWREVIQPPAAWAHDAARVFEDGGSGWVIIPLHVVVAAWLILRRRPLALVVWLVSWGLVELATGVLKHGVGRVRPDLSNTLSFPSGHASAAAQLAVGAVLVLVPLGRSRRWAWAAATAWTVAMSVSRTVLDVHWASDVVAGSLLGAGTTLLVAAVASRSALEQAERVGRDVDADHGAGRGHPG